MDRREAMALSGGAHPYYFHREGFISVGGTVSGSQTSGLQPPPPLPSHGFRTLSSPTFSTQSSARPGSSGPAFSIEPSNANFVHNMNTPATSGVPVGDPVKKKRGRPRKYAPEGQVSIGLSPLPAKPKAKLNAKPVRDPTSPKRARGRPTGTGRKQRLADLGEWVNKSAGTAFAPHVVNIEVGEDIVGKLLSFSQKRPRAVCILSGTGTVSSVTLRQPASSAPGLTYEGLFEILCLSGSYLVAEDGDPHNRTGGISASLSSPDGHVIGGAIGMLIAACPVQVIVCSFVYGESKHKQAGRPKKEKDSGHEHGVSQPAPQKLSDPTNAIPTHHYTPSFMTVWPESQPVNIRNSHSGIDLMRG